MKYNYYETVKEDIGNYITENYTQEEIIEKLLDTNAWHEELNDALWVDDSVTGNASGSYTFNTWQAEENLCHNLDILREALDEFGCDQSDALERGAEYCDVTIRCYLLSGCIWETLDELTEKYSDSIVPLF